MSVLRRLQITDSGGRLAGSSICTSGWTVLLTHSPSVGVCVPVCIQEASVTAGNNSSVHIRCLKVYKCALACQYSLLICQVHVHTQSQWAVKTFSVPITSENVTHTNEMWINVRTASQEPINFLSFLSRWRWNTPTEKYQYLTRYSLKISLCSFLFLLLFSL